MCVGGVQGRRLINTVSHNRYVNIQSEFLRCRSRTEFGLVLKKLLTAFLLDLFLTGDLLIRGRILCLSGSIYFMFTYFLYLSASNNKMITDPVQLVLYFSMTNYHATRVVI